MCVHHRGVFEMFALRFFVIKNADSHVSVCLDDDQIWVVDEITERIFLQLKDVGEGL